LCFRMHHKPVMIQEARHVVRESSARAPKSELATGRVRPIGGPDWRCVRSAFVSKMSSTSIAWGMATRKQEAGLGSLWSLLFRSLPFRRLRYRRQDLKC
jgi:hypothetical protein